MKKGSCAGGVKKPEDGADGNDCSAQEAVFVVEEGSQQQVAIKRARVGKRVLLRLLWWWWWEGDGGGECYGDTCKRLSECACVRKRERLDSV